MTRWIATVACALVAVFGLTASAGAQPRRQLPPEVAALYEQKPVIELVTMGVGGLIWERHGHIALCVRYDDPRDDVCYNYGIGDFRHPIQMAWGFFRGTKSFWAGRQDPREMMAVYRHADRSIWVQPLPLTPEQKMRMLDKLEHDVLEEHKYYSYDHFWDNCTTRVRDIIDDATEGALSKMTSSTDGQTYRELARAGFHGLPRSYLPLLATDLAMGRVTDRPPTYYERMFLPDYLREAVTARWNIPPIAVYDRRGPLAIPDINKRLAEGDVPPAEQQALQERRRMLQDEPSGRLGLALLAVLLTAPAWITRLLGRFQRAGLAFAVIPPVLMGLVFWGLAIISPLPYVRWNETCLALLPLDVLLLVLPRDRRRLYARGRVLMLAGVAALLLVDVLKAPIWPALLWALIPNAVVAFLPEKGAPTPLPGGTERPGRKGRAKSAARA